ncbi:MAG: YceI family protein [Moraxella sp.]|nr:YceI family protein [Moraxella sp.]
MKKLVALSLLMVCGAANAATYEIDPMHTNARFGIDHFATSTNVGGFYGLTGNLQFDRTARTGSIDITIPVKNLQSGSEAFTGHLKSADLFNAAAYPTMRFVSTKFNFSRFGDEPKVTSVDGNLTLLGKTHPVRLKAHKFNCYDSPMLKTEVCGGDFSVTIDRSQWGMNYLLDAGMTKDVRIDIQVEAAKK